MRNNIKEIRDMNEATYFVCNCPKCNKEIKGFSESEVEHNLEAHNEQKCEFRLTQGGQR